MNPLRTFSLCVAASIALAASNAAKADPCPPAHRWDNRMSACVPTGSGGSGQQSGNQSGKPLSKEAIRKLPTGSGKTKVQLRNKTLEAEAQDDFLRKQARKDFRKLTKKDFRKLSKKMERAKSTASKDKYSIHDEMDAAPSDTKLTIGKTVGKGARSVKGRTASKIRSPGTTNVRNPPSTQAGPPSKAAQ